MKVPKLSNIEDNILLTKIIPLIRQLLHLKKLRQILTNKAFMSNYGFFYGRKPNLTDLTDTSILRKQVFSQLELAEILTKITWEYLDKWQSIEKNDYFIGLVLGTLRSLFTYIKK